LDGHVGVVCPVCGVKLRVLQGRVQVSGILVFILPVALGFLLTRFFPINSGSVSGKLALAIFAALYIGAFFLHQHFIPRLLTLRFLKDGESAGFPLVTLAEDLAAERKAIEEDELNQGPPADGAKWVCPKCQEENPGNFDECWKCQTLREAGSLSGSEPA
jgi:hypothetical protein